MNAFFLPVLPVLETAETPIQKLLDTVGNGDNPEADGGFCKKIPFSLVLIFTTSTLQFLLNLYVRIIYLHILQTEASTIILLSLFKSFSDIYTC